jgi:hypothetical protein
MDFAAEEAEVDLVVGLHRAVALGNAACFDQGLR